MGYREDAVSDTGTGQNGLEGKADRDQAKCREIHVSARTGRNIDELREMITALAVRQEPKRRLVGDIIRPHDFVVLVVPIDDAAPKGRLILPQQQTIRDILDTGAAAIVVKDTELQETLAGLGKSRIL